jgi:hypothetical protein
MNIAPMKFPYGIADFGKIRQNGYFYQDRTHLIPQLETAGEQLLFLRPRRFGKSLLLSMLEHYYDINQADSFESLFGELAIGQNPTPLHNQYLILHWDFSLVKTQGDVREIEAALHRCLNQAIDVCAYNYKLAVSITQEDAIYSLGNLLKAVRASGHKIYLFIDEYDNFANEILMARKDQYEALLYGEGLLKTVFKAVKAAAGQGLDRVFITGVSPVALSDITSGYNVATNIYLEPRFNALCGFTETEISDLLNTLAQDTSFTWSVEEALAIMRTFYNGYCFNTEETVTVYNPTLSLYFLNALLRDGHYPRKMLDNNLAMDRKRLLFVAGLLEGESLLLEALCQENGVTVTDISDRFGAETMLKQERDRDTIISLLYYFGILTLGGIVGLNKLAIKIPNLVSRSLYIEQLQDIYLSSAEDRQSLSNVPDGLFLTGDLQPVCEFIETRLFPVLSNRDYRWSNELAIKVIFMMVLFNDRVYMMVSEAEVQHGYADLSLIVRPDMRRFQALDLVLEFKYLGLKELGLSGEEVKTRSREALSQIPSVAEKLKEAREQVLRYGQVLKTRYNLTTLTGFAVVALGLERIVFERIE